MRSPGWLGGPWTTQRVLAGVFGLLKEIWTAPFILGLIGLANTTAAWRAGCQLANGSGRRHEGLHPQREELERHGPSGTGGVTVYRPEIVYSHEVGSVRLQGDTSAIRRLLA